MERERFEQLVYKAISELPQEFLDKLDNVDIVVDNIPQKPQPGGLLRLGLYEGVPAVMRGSGYNLVVPDKITIFQESIESIASTDNDIEIQVREVVVHEIAHYFGLDDRRLDEISAEKRSKPVRS